MKSKFEELLTSLNNAGYAPKTHELKSIILSHATREVKSSFVGRAPRIIEDNGKQLTEFIVKAELSKVDFSKTKSHRKAVEAEVRKNIEVPISIHTAFCNLPNDLEELKAIDNYIVNDGKLIEKQ